MGDMYLGPEQFWRNSKNSDFFRNWGGGSLKSFSSERICGMQV